MIRHRGFIIPAMALSATAFTSVAATVSQKELPAQLADIWTFDKDDVGKVPEHWSIRQTNPSEKIAAWSVKAEKEAPSEPNVLQLTETHNADGTFNLAIADQSSIKDFDLAVTVRADSGKEDQGGGPIWRAKNENNYYICRFNPLESNFRVYKVVDGKRKQLAGATVNSAAGQWYTVRVTMVGGKITCYLNGTKHLEATDDTFPDAGMVGLWTKADAATSFDDLIVRKLGRGEKPGDGN